MPDCIPPEKARLFLPHTKKTMQKTGISQTSGKNVNCFKKNKRLLYLGAINLVACITDNSPKLINEC